MITIGTQLFLDAEDTNTGTFRSKVVEVTDSYLLIDYPVEVESGKTAFLSEGRSFRASFTLSEQATFWFPTHISGREKRNVPVIRITYPGKEGIVKIQRRQFVRVETAIDVALKIGNEHKAFISDDISAGGCSVVLKGEAGIGEGEQISALLVLPFSDRQTKYLWFDTKVVRIVEKGQQTVASLEFLEPSDQARQLIVRFCFERQLQMRNKSIYA